MEAIFYHSNGIQSTKPNHNLFFISKIDNIFLHKNNKLISRINFNTHILYDYFTNYFFSPLEYVVNYRNIDINYSLGGIFSDIKIEKKLLKNILIKFQKKTLLKYYIC